MDLSKKDRLIIANQLKILEKLYPDEADYYAKHRKAIEDGYKLHYNWLVENFYHEMSEEECKEVLEILDMYRALTFSYQHLDNKSEIDETEIRFRGFDGNNETSQYSYTQYFIVDLGRFDELTYGAKYSNFNSHCPMLDRYHRMVAVWKQCRDKFNLSKDEIRKILEA